MAAALGTTGYERLLDPDAPSTGLTDEAKGILLKRETSGIRLVDAIVDADEIDFGVAFEPWPEQVEVVRPLLRFLEELFPRTFESIYEYDSALCNSAAARMETASKVNAGLAQLARLKPEGLHLLFGRYTVVGKRVRWDNDEGHWYTTMRQREEVLTVAALRVASASTMSLRIPLRGKPVPSEDDEDISW